MNRAIEAAVEYATCHTLPWPLPLPQCMIYEAMHDRRGDGARIKKMMGASVLNDLDFYFMVADGQATSVQYGNKAPMCNALAKPFPDDEAMIAAFGIVSHHDPDNNSNGDGDECDALVWV